MLIATRAIIDPHLITIAATYDLGLSLLFVRSLIRSSLPLLLPPWTFLAFRMQADVALLEVVPQADEKDHGRFRRQGGRVHEPCDEGAFRGIDIVVLEVGPFAPIVWSLSSTMLSPPWLFLARHSLDCPMAPIVFHALFPSIASTVLQGFSPIVPSLTFTFIIASLQCCLFYAC